MDILNVNTTYPSDYEDDTVESTDLTGGQKVERPAVGSKWGKDNDFVVHVPNENGVYNPLGVASERNVHNSLAQCATIDEYKENYDTLYNRYMADDTLTDYEREYYIKQLTVEYENERNLIVWPWFQQFGKHFIDKKDGLCHGLVRGRYYQREDGTYDTTYCNYYCSQHGRPKDSAGKQYVCACSPHPRDELGNAVVYLKGAYRPLRKNEDFTFICRLAYPQRVGLDINKQYRDDVQKGLDAFERNLNANPIAKQKANDSVFEALIK